MRLYPGHAGWHFATIDKKKSKMITELFGRPRRGWGSIPVTVTLGATEWNTSIFPVTKDKTYVLGLKAAVRKAERIAEGDRIRLHIRIREI